MYVMYSLSHLPMLKSIELLVWGGPVCDTMQDDFTDTT